MRDTYAFLYSGYFDDATADLNQYKQYKSAPDIYSVDKKDIDFFNRTQYEADYADDAITFHVIHKSITISGIKIGKNIDGPDDFIINEHKWEMLCDDGDYKIYGYFHFFNNIYTLVIEWVDFPDDDIRFKSITKNGKTLNLDAQNHFNLAKEWARTKGKIITSHVS